MANEQNLKPPWPKGVSGNYGGKPKGRTVRSALRHHLQQADPKKPVQERRQSAAEKLWDESEKDAGFMLDMLKWLEGSSPKESEPEHEDEPEPASDEELATFHEGIGDEESGIIRQPRKQEEVGTGEAPDASEREAT